MKYPNILFLRSGKYKDIDEFINSNRDKFDFTINIIEDYSDLNKLFDTNYHLLVTYGSTNDEYIYGVNSIITDRMRKKWIHKSTIEDIELVNRGVNYCYIDNVINNRELTRSTFSIFTTCYNSYDKIYRVFNSLKRQTFRDWEWVIIDDSPDDEHFNFLKNISKDDKRIRLFKKDFNSGNIGNVKNEAVSLCRGKYILEFDHDDEMVSDVLQNAFDVFENDNNVGFIYMDFINIYENGENFKYGEFICKGYGAYYCQKYDGKWRYVYNTPNVNNITLSHLICCPNHPRIWRKSVLLEIGNYSEYLPICDDYEILLRTAISTKIVKIAKLGYIQYMNNENNNFSLIRNAEINRIGPRHISSQFYQKYQVSDIMKDKNAYEDEYFMNHHSKLWKRQNYEPKYCNLKINNDYDKQYCIIGIEKLDESIIRELYDNQKNDFIVLDNKNSLEKIQEKIDKNGFDRMKCYYFEDCTKDELVKYFHLIYKSSSNYEIIYDTEIKIIDCFTFYNELDILEFRLEELYDYVDYFILVESTFTHTNSQKILFYDDNKDRYRKYEDKIIHIIVDDMPCGENSWINENHQRRCINRGIKTLKLNNNDIIIISDVDEIIDKKRLIEIRSTGINGIYKLEQDLYYYNLTCKDRTKWNLARILDFSTYKVLNNDPQYIRDNRSDDITIIKKAGWHFSWFGNINFIKNKIKNFGHQEYNKEEFLDDNKIKKQIENSDDLFFRETGKNGHTHDWYKIDIEENDYLPENYKMLLNPQKKYEKTILFYTGYNNKLWNYSYRKYNALGGAETAVALLAKSFPKKYEIIISGSVKYENIENVTYLDEEYLQKFLDNNELDLIVVNRYISFFEKYIFNSKNVYVWLHDSPEQEFSKDGFLKYNCNLSIAEILEKHENKISKIITLNNWHKSKIEKLYPNLENKLYIIGNGINLNLFPIYSPQKIKNKFIYTSTPDRGLQKLLEIWPNIKKNINNAELFIATYAELSEDMEEIINKTESIHFLGKLEPKKLYEEMYSSEYWLYPCTKTETCPITVYEMLYSSVICICYPTGGIPDTLKNYGILIKDGDELDTIMDLSIEKKLEMRKNGREYAATLTWESKITDWAIDINRKNILLLYTSHRQINECEMSSIFLNKTKAIKNFDLIHRCNNIENGNKIKPFFEKYPNKNKELIITDKNFGYWHGDIEALDDLYNKLKDYDYVIQIHPDIYIVNEEPILELIKYYRYKDDVFIFTKSYPDDDTFLSFYFFIFKPILLNKNIFSEWKNEKDNKIGVEKIMYKILNKNNIKYSLIKRFDNDFWSPRRIDTLGLWHEHENEKVIEYLRDNINKRIYILMNNKVGGCYKYTEDLISVYKYNNIIYIDGKDKLNSIEFKNNDILLLVNLIFSNIEISDIINIKDNYNINLYITCHDFIWLSNENIHYYNDSIPSCYLSDDIIIKETVKDLFDRADKIIMNSIFTFNVYSKYFDTNKMQIIYNNDYKIIKNIINIPDITNNTINIGMLAEYCVFKGSELINYLVNKYNKYKNYDINFRIVGKTVPKYDEKSFFEFIKKYNIHGALLLNKWGETYCYTLTKIINSGLPLLYNNFGVFNERIPLEMNHYFKVFEDETEYNDKDLLENKFELFLYYIIKNNGIKCKMAENTTIESNNHYDKLFM